MMTSDVEVCSIAPVMLSYFSLDNSILSNDIALHFFILITMMVITAFV